MASEIRLQLNNTSSAIHLVTSASNFRHGSNIALYRDREPLGVQNWRAPFALEDVAPKPRLRALEAPVAETSSLASGPSAA